MKLASIFGGYADRLQVVIDNSKSKFAPLWYPNYFSWSAPQLSLTFTSVIGRTRIEAAASVISADSGSPLRSRAGLEKLSGEINPISEKLKMTQSDYRDFMALQSLSVDDQTRRNAILDFLFNDVKLVGNAAHKRLDIMALEAVSSGYISLDVNNNPDGIVLGEKLDLLMPDANRSESAVSWETAATATPITDIESVVSAGRARGVAFTKILMSLELWLKFKKAKEVIDTLAAYYYGPKPGGSFNPVAVSTIERVNEFMAANQLPVIEIVDEVIGVEKDGVIGTVKPFNQNNASFIPAGNLGEIKNALAIEQMKPVDKVNYATYDRALISKWSENEPFAEWTKVELNAFPALSAIDSIFILEAVHA